MDASQKAYRSMLFVPGDSERKIEKSFGVGADALIFDLEDAVMPERRPEARALVRATLDRTRGQPGSHRWVRVNPIDSGIALVDLLLRLLLLRLLVQGCQARPIGRFCVGPFRRIKPLCVPFCCSRAVRELHL